MRNIHYVQCEQMYIDNADADGFVYVWHRETGVLLEILNGHGDGSVNDVAWNPQNPNMFASCSDDWSIRIWESPISVSRSSHPLTARAQSPVASSKGKGRELDAIDLASGSLQ